MTRTRRPLMSSATPSHPAPPVSDERSTGTAWLDRAAAGVRATAFWSATALPLVIFAGLAVGSAGEYPLALAAVLALNVVCAVVGHGHSPNR